MIRNIITLYESVAVKEPYALLINAALFIAIICCAYFLVKYLQEHNVYRRLVAKFKADMAEQTRLREEEYRQQLEMEGQFETKNRMNKLNQKLISSGISNAHPEMTAEMFTLNTFSFTILIGFLLQFIYKDIMVTTIGVCANFFVWNLLLEMMITYNYNSLERETLKFINLLKNVSHTEGTLAEMFARTVPYISDPLKSSIEKCYYEIKATGNTEVALQHLCERTNYKKLREIFEAIKVCAANDGNYESVVDESSENVRMYVAYRKEMQRMRRSNMYDIIIMGIAGFVMLYALQSMLTNIEVVHYLFNELVGQCIMICLFAILAHGIYRVIKGDN